jgi:formylglycine-generating enzyme required for sulfatase activity
MCTRSIRIWIVSICLAGAFLAAPRAVAQNVQVDCQKLRAAISDLFQSYPDRYPNAPRYLHRLEQIEGRLAEGDKSAALALKSLRREALLANPLIADLPGLLLVKRKPKRGKGKGAGLDIGMPSNHECNASLERDDYDNEISVLAPVAPDGKLTTLYRPQKGRYVGELDLHFDGARLLFTQSDAANWKLCEIGVDGTGLRTASQMPDDVDAMDGCYLPNGKIVFGATASYQSVPCWHGQKRVSNLYLMGGDGENVRRLCFDQDHNFHPTVLPTGQVIYHRWDYTGICHIFQRELMTMNPDGTQQRAAYGSNSWYPNSLFFPRPLPDSSGRLISILSGYHGVHRMGQLVIIDPRSGTQEAAGIVQRITGRGKPVEPQVRDALPLGDWPMFLHPYPLSEKYFLVSCWMNARSSWGIYLADVFDNLVLVREMPGYALLEPTPLGRRPQPPAIPEHVDLAKNDATVYINDVYTGPGLAGVPRGTIKGLRLVGYHFGYRGLAGSDKIGYGGPWDAMRILGTVPVENDGSASFHIPANTPVAVQTLDAEGKAVQLMRSWFTAMPGERVSCVGCHERPKDVANVRLTTAAAKAPRRPTPWYGPPRGFDFEREVQPVVDKYCVSCHDGSKLDLADLRSEADGGKSTPKPIGYVSRLHPDHLAATGGKLRYSPAYDVLVHYIRRVGVEDDVSLLTPGEYHADTSELVQMLQKGHHGVTLDKEAWDRIVTWIDLNGPCHGTWGDVFPIPDGAHERRRELSKLYGGAVADPEKVFATSRTASEAVATERDQRPEPLQLANWPVSRADAVNKQASLGPTLRELDLGNGVTMKLRRIPGGQFVMGDVNGAADEYPQQAVRIDRSFWIGQCEVTNAQLRRFDPTHDSGYYVKRRDRADGKGLSFNGDEQPAVRVSWETATAFCEWLSKRAGVSVSLPAAEQWEYACRAGSETSLSYGTINDDFSLWGNMGDLSFSTGVMQSRGRQMPEGGATQVTGGVPHLLLEGARLAETRFDDRHRVTANVGSFRPNAWGTQDMHGNAAEWTLEEDGDRKIVRGGSFFDRPARCRSSFRLAYPAWQRVFNVGFRVVVANEIR